MSPVTLTQPLPEMRPDMQGFSDGTWALINHLRMVALDCRAKPRTDLFRACALLSLDKTKARNAHAEALMRCLRDALGQTPRLHRPGEAELSFDETWLMRLAEAVALQDHDSATFLLCSRVREQDRRNFRYLIFSVSECFSLI